MAMVIIMAITMVTEMIINCNKYSIGIMTNVLVIIELDDFKVKD